MSPELAAVGQRVADQLKPLLDEAFIEVRDAPGERSERQNDALSTLANIGASVAAQLVIRLVETKGIPPGIGLDLASAEIDARATAWLVDGLREALN
jgi:hypothetical protein